MPVSDPTANEQNLRIKALAEFIDRHLEHTFVLTCRVRDYLQLRDYSETFRLFKYQLRDWTPQMFRRYLGARGSENAQGLQSIEQTLQRAYQSNSWGQFTNSPLLAALLFRGGGSVPHSIGDLWQLFLNTLLKPELPDTLRFDEALDKLSRFAYARTLDPAEPYPLQDSIRIAAQKAGLISQSEGTPEFTIKPLQHYFATLYMKNLINKDHDYLGETEITHVKFRVVCVLLSELLGNNAEFLKNVVSLLQKSDSPYLCARRVNLFASCLSAAQLGADPELSPSFIDALEYVLEKGNAGHANLVVEGINHRPEILSGATERVAELRLKLLVLRPLELERRLFQLLLSSWRIAWHFRSWLAELIGRFANEARLGRELGNLIDQRAERLRLSPLPSRAAHQLFQLLRVAYVASYLYCFYLVCLALAHLAIHRTANLLILPWSYGGAVILFPHTVSGIVGRFAFLAVSVIMPWFILVRQARVGLRFATLGLRVLALLCLAVVIRYCLLLPLLGVTVLNTIASGVEFGIVAGLMFMPAAVLMSGLLRARGAARGAVASARDRTPFQSSRGILRRIAEGMRGRPTRRTVLKIVGLMSGSSMLLLLLIVYRLEKYAGFLVCVGVVAYLLKRLMINPYLQYRRNVAKISQYTLANLSIDFYKTVDDVRLLLLNPKLPKIFKYLYIRVLEKRVRWDDTLLELFEELAAEVSLDNEVRNYLEIVVTRKREEVEQNSNPTGVLLD
jgi:hypothetical protein